MSGKADDQEHSVAERGETDDKMKSSDADAEQHFPFMKLSGELRNRIYHYLFDFDSISISDVHTSPYDKDSDDTRILIQDNVLKRRTHYTIEYHSDQMHDSTGVTTTYYLKGTFLDLPFNFRVFSPPPVHTHIFLVNRQIFREARSIFYSTRFEHSQSVECLLAFLQDLPKWTYEHIRSIKLLCPVDDDLNDFICKSRFSPKAWKETCEFIQVNLTLKELQFRLLVPDLWLEKKVSNGFQGLEWIEPLIKISGLERLKIEVVCCIEDEEPEEDQCKLVGHIVGCLRDYLSSKTLKQGGELACSYQMLG
ncbi:MAG: hypothetical protein M1836_005073 [Candelina mexicana]|nr:MAG: hypothetical protein M1836_005073 [Candelina mexicana]